MSFPSTKQDDLEALFIEDHHAGHIRFDGLDCPLCMAVLECPHCGGTGDPIRIEERDPTVGYFAIVEKCTLCFNK